MDFSQNDDQSRPNYIVYNGLQYFPGEMFNTYPPLIIRSAVPNNLETNQNRQAKKTPAAFRSKRPYVRKTPYRARNRPVEVKPKADNNDQHPIVPQASINQPCLLKILLQNPNEPTSSASGSLPNNLPDQPAPPESTIVAEKISYSLTNSGPQPSTAPNSQPQSSTATYESNKSLTPSELHQIFEQGGFQHCTDIIDKINFSDISITLVKK